MASAALNITGQRQLMIDPRVVEKVYNVFPALAEAKKLGKVISLDEKYRGKRAILYSTVVWDERISKVRIYYTLLSTGQDGKRSAKVESSDGIHFEEPKLNVDEQIALAESSDGIHFEKPRLGFEVFEGDRDNNIIRIEMNIPHNDRILEPRKIDHPIQMTGKLDDPAWKQAPATINFLKTGSMALSEFGTTVRVLYDNQAAYFGFECPGKKDWSQIKPSPNLYSSEVVEVLIDPKLTRNEHYYFAVNCFGQTTQERHVKTPHPLGEGWQKQWQAAADRRPDGWSAVFKIPLKTIELEPKQTDCAWGVNMACSYPALTKDEYARYTNWAGASLHHQHDQFGALVFDLDEFKNRHRPLWEELSRDPVESEKWIDAPCVFIDPNGPESERYKITWSSGAYASNSFMWAGASADGISFKAQKTVIDDVNLDSPNIVVWDPLKKKYVAYTRWWFSEVRTLPQRRRGVARTESDRWAVQFPRRQPVMDPIKYRGNEMGYRDFHSTGFFVYENLYLALTTIYWRDVDTNPFMKT